MATKKPRCTDFIVEAIRAIRSTKHAGLKPGTSTGVQLRKIFLVTTSVYSEKEFRGALQDLLQKSILILAAKSYTWNNNEESRNGGYSSCKLTRIVHVPPNAPFSEKRWDFNEASKERVDPVTAKKGLTYRELRLYVVKDGPLPTAVAGLLTDSPHRRNHGALEAIASEILRKLQK